MFFLCLFLAFKRIIGLKGQAFETAAHFFYRWTHKILFSKFCEKKRKINKDTITNWNNYLQKVSSKQPWWLKVRKWRLTIVCLLAKKTKPDASCHNRECSVYFIAKSKNALLLMCKIVRPLLWCKWICPRTRIILDSWRAYNGI